MITPGPSSFSYAFLKTVSCRKLLSSILTIGLCALLGFTAEFVRSQTPQPGSSAPVPVRFTAPGNDSASGSSFRTFITTSSQPRAGSAQHAVPSVSSTPTAATPQFSLAPGVYPNAQTVAISDATPGATIYYTTNGSEPSTNSAVYTSAITVSASEVIVAMATAPGYQNSLAWGLYVISSVPSSFVYTVAGSNSWGYSGDGGLATAARLNAPTGTAVDNAGNLYIADDENNRLRKIDASTGIITTIAGTGTAGHTGDGGPATGAELWWPYSIAIDASGNIYIGETGDNVVRVINAATGNISTYAGSPTAVSLGDGGPATSAQLASPEYLAFDSAGNLYIDTPLRVRMVAASTKIITTVAGNGINGYTGDNGPATLARLGNVFMSGIAVSPAGDLYIADTVNNAIRKVDHSTGIITTVAGLGPTAPGYSGDGGPAVSAKLNFPSSVVFDGAGNLYIADTYNSVIREVTASNGIINTIAGDRAFCFSYDRDGSPATSSALCYPQALTFDSKGNLYFAEPN
ncbi:MAG TPA: chitobiase/beta-hexosaminidase C-terminal domain-containing protein [Sphingomicrobium sp.]|nr:chitobiase/beta-hexosaminidase C-terminal domain-containing protein [Sphingomicrobium sp.]